MKISKTTSITILCHSTSGRIKSNLSKKETIKSRLETKRHLNITMNIILQYLLILNFLAPHSTLPHRTSPIREPRGIDLLSDEDSKSSKRREDCSRSNVIHTSSNNDNYSRDECLEENHQLPLKVLTCLNNCANCVKQWRTGVYNGRNCANDCMKQSSEENAVESMDPDCNRMKYFNSTYLSSVK